MSIAPAPGMNIKQVALGGGTFGPREVEQMSQALGEDPLAHRLLREAVNEMESSEDRSPAAAVRLGVCYYLLGPLSPRCGNAEEGRWRRAGAVLPWPGRTLRWKQYDQADGSLSGGGPGRLRFRHLLAGPCGNTARGRQASCGAGSARQAVGAVEQTAEYLYQRGATVSALSGNPSEVVALFERAVAADPKHAGALFGLAMENDRHGNDETAIDLYERSLTRYPAHVGSLLNLGILYEDRTQYDRALHCYQRILDAFPNHPRARLYVKDVNASRDMFYDEDEQPPPRSPEPGDERAGHRFRAFGPQPQLPAKDGRQ